MLDGFIIEGNVLEQASKKLDKDNVHILKKHYPAILVSVVVHLVLLIVLFFTSENQQAKQVKQIKIIPKAIKSYLYKTPPKPVIAKQEEIKPVLEKDKTLEKTIDIKQKKPVTEKKKVLEQKKNLAVISSPESSPSKAETKNQSKKPVQASFSAYKQLDNLRQSINNKMMTQELSSLQKFRSPSVMHGKQIPVPHSNLLLTPEQEREKKVTRMSNDISITKYDNGLCTIERKQFLGSPVEGSISAFACGESKFDKSFREHMKKVQEKILPVRNK